MELRPAVLDILELVETTTGYPVVVSAMPGLDTVVAVQMARGAAAVHRVLVHPAVDVPPDYLIARECGRILRVFAASPGERFVIAPSAAGREAVTSLLHAPDGVVHRYRLDTGRAESLRDKLYAGLMLQLRSTPIGLRVDRWLTSTFGDLEDLQRTAVEGELADGRAMLAPDVRALTPPAALVAALAMHAAEAAYWAREWSAPELIEPYRATGSFRDGGALMRAWREIPEAPGCDRELVDTWAGMIGMAGWYDWRPYATPAGG